MWRYSQFSRFDTANHPVGVGYYQEFAGNITGDFHRATQPITVMYEGDHGSQVIFRLPNGKRGMTRKDLLVSERD